MYAALYRMIPGPRFVKIVVMLALLAAVVWVLFNFVFPWANQTFVMPPEATTV